MANYLVSFTVPNDRRVFKQRVKMNVDKPISTDFQTVLDSIWSGSKFMSAVEVK